MKNVKDCFKERFFALRKDSGLSQAKLSKELNLSAATIGYYENGDRIPDIEIAERIAKYFNVSADYLLGLSDAKTTEQNIKIACEVTGLSDDVVNTLHSKIVNNNKNKKIYNYMISNEIFHNLASLLGLSESFAESNNKYTPTKYKKNYNNSTKEDIFYAMCCFRELTTVYAIKETAKEWAADVVKQISKIDWENVEKLTILMQKSFSIGGGEYLNAIRDVIKEELGKKEEDTENAKHNTPKE